MSWISSRPSDTRFPPIFPPFLDFGDVLDSRPNKTCFFIFKIDTLGIRAIPNIVSRTFTISSPNPHRSDTLRLVVIPNSGNGFTETADCTPSTSHVGGLTNCRLKLAAPARLFSGQPITWRMTTATCFGEAVATAPYDPNATFQVFPFPPLQTEANVQVRSVNGSGCGSATGIPHILEAWVGDFRMHPQATAATSGPGYTKDTITVLRP